MTITPEQLDSLISYTRQLADKGSPYAACNHTQLSELLERLKKAEASVAELEAEVRRLTASLAEMRECYIARTADRDKAEARVTELEKCLAEESTRIYKEKSLRLQKAEADRAVLRERLTGLLAAVDEEESVTATTWEQIVLARAALAKVMEAEACAQG